MTRDTETGRGFIYAMDERSAKRQLQFSLSIVVLIGLAVVAAAFDLHLTVQHPDRLALVPTASDPIRSLD